MSENSKLFEMASLAEAAYADLFKDGALQTDRAEVKNILIANKWSATQADEFLTHYRVVSQQPNTDTGYSATLFERLDADGSLTGTVGAGTGQYVFAQRGTEALAQAGLDLAVDIGDLVADGLAWSQIVDMYNYWKQLTTPENQHYQKATIVLQPFPPVSGGFILDRTVGLVAAFFRTIQLADAISPAGPKVPVGAPLEVAGHSLGGHLASAFTRLFAGVASQAYTMNGAGYAEILGSSNVQYVFSQLGGASSFTSAAVQNLRGSAGPGRLRATRHGPERPVARLCKPTGARDRGQLALDEADRQAKIPSGTMRGACRSWRRAGRARCGRAHANGAGYGVVRQQRASSGMAG